MSLTSLFMPKSFKHHGLIESRQKGHRRSSTTIILHMKQQGPHGPSFLLVYLQLASSRAGIRFQVSWLRPKLLLLYHVGSSKALGCPPVFLSYSQGASAHRILVFFGIKVYIEYRCWTELCTGMILFYCWNMPRSRFVTNSWLWANYWLVITDERIFDG